MSKNIFGVKSLEEAKELDVLLNLLLIGKFQKFDDLNAAIRGSEYTFRHYLALLENMDSSIAFREAEEDAVGLTGGFALLKKIIQKGGFERIYLEEQ